MESTVTIKTTPQELDVLRRALDTYCVHLAENEGLAPAERRNNRVEQLRAAELRDALR